MRLCQPVSVVAVISKVYLLPLCQFSNRVPMTFRRRDRQREDAIGKRHFDSSTGSSAARSVGRSGSHSAGGVGRSEEHTSELQSRFDLVCRLLLEKKKKTYKVTLHRKLLSVRKFY